MLQLSERGHLLARADEQPTARLLRLIRASQVARQPAPITPSRRKLLAARLWIALVRPRARRAPLLAWR
jgi:hypothetical protein